MARSVLIGVSGLLGLGALAFGVLGGLSLSAATFPATTVNEVRLRPFPGASAPSPAPTAGDAGAPAPSVDAGTPPAPAPAPAVDAGAPTPTPPTPTPPAPTPTPPPVKDAGVAAPTPPRPPPPPPQPVGEGLLNLRASDTADVYVDGKKVGGSPIDGLKVKAGTHKVRFDCYDAAGNTVPGTPKSVTVAADGEQSVDYECPAAE